MDQFNPEHLPEDAVDKMFADAKRGREEAVAVAWINYIGAVAALQSTIDDHNRMILLRKGDGQKS